ncbi:radical SAM protein [bacterium]|nr:radical SAM protein [bacterium]
MNALKISLVVPPLYGVDMPPLGIAYIAAQLIYDGYDVKMHCLNSKLYHEKKAKRFLWDWESSDEWATETAIGKHFNLPKLLEDWSLLILENNPKVIGLSVNSHSWILANLLSGKLKEKKKDLFILFGGPWCAEVTENDLNNNVDVYVRGEGEKIVSELVKKIVGGESIRSLSIKGTIINTGNGFRDNGWNKEQLNINSIPFPALHLFHFERYTNKDEIPIIFSRGCNYYCKFCTDKAMWGNYRMREANNIAEEMMSHNKMFKRKRFKSNDLMINGDLKELEGLADMLIEKEAGFEWGGMARADPKMTQELFQKLKQAGCIYLTYGVESGASRVLRHMGKPLKWDIAKALKMTHSSGIKVNTLWMVGYPVERRVDILETILFLLMNRKNIDEFVSVSACYIPRKSYLWEQQEELRIKHNADSQWYIGRTNTHSVRYLRRKILLYFAKFLGLYKGGIS